MCFSSQHRFCHLHYRYRHHFHYLMYYGVYHANNNRRCMYIQYIYTSNIRCLSKIFEGNIQHQKLTSVHFHAGISILTRMPSFFKNAHVMFKSKFIKFESFCIFQKVFIEIYHHLILVIYMNLKPKTECMRSSDIVVYN